MFDDFKDLMSSFLTKDDVIDKLIELYTNYYIDKHHHSVVSKVKTYRFYLVFNQLSLLLNEFILEKIKNNEIKPYLDNVSKHLLELLSEVDVKDWDRILSEDVKLRKKEVFNMKKAKERSVDSYGVRIAKLLDNFVERKLGAKQQ